jgi:hypothetical protein
VNNTTDLIIEKDIPLPKRTGGRVTNMIKSMNEGDSVVVPTRQAYMAFAQALKRIGYGVVSRREGDGWRIWKIKRKVVDTLQTTLK